MRKRPSRRRPSRRRAAAAFAVVGLLAGAAHVLATEPGSLRLWREVLPLAALIGAALGALVRPVGWGRGALVALLAAPAFAVAYAIAEAAMMASRGDIVGVGEWLAAVGHWTVVVLGKAAIGAAAAMAGGAAAGRWLGRRSR